MKSLMYLQYFERQIYNDIGLSLNSKDLIENQYTEKENLYYSEMRWALKIKASWMSITFNGIQIKFIAKEKMFWFLSFQTLYEQTGARRKQRLICFSSLNINNLYKREERCIIWKFRSQ